MDENSDTPNSPQDPSSAEEYNKLLQEELNKHKKDMAALQGEFNLAANEANEQMSADAARKALVVGANEAIQEIIRLSTTADSESARLSASKYIVEVCLGRMQVGDPADTAFTKFIEGLKKPSPKSKKDKAE